MKALTAVKLAGALALATFAGGTTSPFIQASEERTMEEKTSEEKTMQLGNFSVSLAVKDIKASQAFYEQLDFKPVGGKIEQNWLVLQNGTTTIGLFQGMFEQNIMTFNPGWTRSATALDDFQDVRDIQSILQEKGITPTTAADPDSTGPASCVLTDPDGNTILIDQHVPKPGNLRVLNAGRGRYRGPCSPGELHSARRGCCRRSTTGPA